MVAEIEEQEPTVIAAPVQPTRNGHGPADIGAAQAATGVQHAIGFARAIRIAGQQRLRSFGKARMWREALAGSRLLQMLGKPAKSLATAKDPVYENFVPTGRRHGRGRP